MPYDDDKMPFYALGTNLATQVGGNLRDLLDKQELEVVVEAIQDNLRGGDREEANAILTKYGPELNNILKTRAEEATQQMRKEGAAFVEDFLKENPKAKKTDSGLVFLETKAGDGESPTLMSLVEMHYHGTSTGGIVVDSSVDRGEPVSIPVNGAVPGLAEGLQMMKVGCKLCALIPCDRVAHPFRIAKATLVVPPELAYGDAGSGDAVPPGATLKFEVELLGVQEQPSQAAPAIPDDMETEILETPDGTKIRVPKGVKMRTVKDEGTDNPPETIDM